MYLKNGLLPKTINENEDPWDYMEDFSTKIMNKYNYNIGN